MWSLKNEPRFWLLVISYPALILLLIIQHAHSGIGRPWKLCPTVAEVNVSSWGEQGTWPRWGNFKFLWDLQLGELTGCVNRWGWNGPFYWWNVKSILSSVVFSINQSLLHWKCMLEEFCHPVSLAIFKRLLSLLNAKSYVKTISEEQSIL